MNSIKGIPVQTDIYLIDQILKDRYIPGETILDAGCGNGRNMEWFLQNNFSIYGIDSGTEVIKQLQKNYPDLSEEIFSVSSVELTRFADKFFDHVICSAVLHFADNTSQFRNMLNELVRILKPGGSLFIRMASDIGLEDKVSPVADGVYFIPDGSKRFLLNRELLKSCMEQHGLSFIEPLKTVNVDDIRCMSTLVLIKN